jgi:hypothetical protein
LIVGTTSNTKDNYIPKGNPHDNKTHCTTYIGFL